MLQVVLFFIFYFLAVAYEQQGFKSRNIALAIVCSVFAIIAGLRSWEWPDTGIYIVSFWRTHTLSEFSFTDRPMAYSEIGFYFLASIIKTILDDDRFYLMVISGLTFYFLFKDLKKYSLFPLVGLFAYISRFYIGRNFIQMRAGLAYVILMLSIKYIYEKDWKRYFIIVFIAWTIHRSALIAIPLYFICNWIKVKKWHVYVAIVVSFLIGLFGQGFMHNFIEDNASDLTITAYTEQGDKRYVESLGLSNPIIYFQCFILLIYTFLEKRLASQDKYYYIFRTAYLYSTSILICFCSYKVLAARTASIYATLEFAIIPALIYMFNKKNRQFAFFATGLVLTAIFYMYINQ